MICHEILNIKYHSLTRRYLLKQHKCTSNVVINRLHYHPFIIIFLLDGGILHWIIHFYRNSSCCCCCCYIYCYCTLFKLLNTHAHVLKIICLNILLRFFRFSLCLHIRCECGKWNHMSKIIKKSRFLYCISNHISLLPIYLPARLNPAIYYVAMIIF